MDDFFNGLIEQIKNAPPVDVEALRKQYRAEHAEEIAAHEKYMADMRMVCRIFEGEGCRK